jgi:hypothetical protein
MGNVWICSCWGSGVGGARAHARTPLPHTQGICFSKRHYQDVFFNGILIANLQKYYIRELLYLIHACVWMGSGRKKSPFGAWLNYFNIFWFCKQLLLCLWNRSSFIASFLFYLVFFGFTANSQYITRTYGLWWLRLVIHIKPSTNTKATRDNMKAYVAVHDSSEA